jgi:hypothetical protein
MMKMFIISADLGQVNDYTAITVFERVKEGLLLRQIERVELGTTYPKIVDRLKAMAESPNLDSKDMKVVVIDITGVGRPVWDLMQQARIKATLEGISITGGNTVNRDGDIYHVPKRDLVTSLQIAFQNGDLKIAPGLPYYDILVKEMTNFNVTVNINGNDQYGAHRDGDHDDLVLSAAMGVWAAKRPRFNIMNLIT